MADQHELLDRINKCQDPTERAALIELDPLDHEIRAGNRIAPGGAAVRTQFGMMRRAFRYRNGTVSGPGRGRGGRGAGSSVEAQEAVSSEARASSPIRAMEGADNAPMLQEEPIAEQVEEQRNRKRPTPSSKNAPKKGLTTAQKRKMAEEEEEKKRAEAEERRRLAILQRDQRNPDWLRHFVVAKKDFTNSKE